MSGTGMVGWDFSRLAGRMFAEDPDWDFEAICLDAMLKAWRVLDMGTGGGERLMALVQAGSHTAQVAATEGWGPNISVARDNLRRFGVEVVVYDAETDSRMPFGDGAFDLVMNRHEALDPTEIARVLEPGGVFLTQQVDGNELPELRQRFGGQPAYPNVTLALQRALLQKAGLTVTVAEDWSGSLTFVDTNALDEYLTLVPWDRPAAFDPQRLPAGPIVLTQRRFWMQATRKSERA